jgi:hypothetical protein
MLPAEEEAKLLGLRHTLDKRFARVRESLAAATLASLDAEMLTGAHLADTAQAVRNDIESMLAELDHWAYDMIPLIRDHADRQIAGIATLLMQTQDPQLTNALLKERTAWIGTRNRCVEVMKPS